MKERRSGTVHNKELNIEFISYCIWSSTFLVPIPMHVYVLGLLMDAFHRLVRGREDCVTPRPWNCRIENILRRPVSVFLIAPNDTILILVVPEQMRDSSGTQLPETKVIMQDRSGCGHTTVQGCHYLLISYMSTSFDQLPHGIDVFGDHSSVWSTFTRHNGGICLLPRAKYLEKCHRIRKW